MKKISHNYLGSTHYIEFSKELKKTIEETRFEGTGKFISNEESSGPPIIETGVNFLDTFNIYYVICPICKEQIETRRKLIESVKF